MHQGRDEAELVMPHRSSSYAGTLPYWADSAVLPAFAPLERDLETDVVVVGGGLTGLTAACLLAKAGRSVVVLERATCASIDTGHTTAHLTMVTDMRMKDLVRRFGSTHAQAVWDAGLAAISQIDALIREHGIDCGFDWIDGYLHAPAGTAAPEQIDALRQDADVASELGFDAVFVEHTPHIGGPGIRFARQARFHPRRYLAGLARVITSRGGYIFEHSPAEEFADDDLCVRSRGYRVRCQDIVIATHNPLVGVAGLAHATLFQTKLALYTTYVVAGRVPRGTVPDALFWDTSDPYQYLRIDPAHDHDIVIFGGEDHKTGQVSDTDACFARLERALSSRISSIQLTHRWSGQVIETSDGLPYIGRMTDHQYTATGCAGNGMTFGTLGAMVMSDAILQRKNPWTELFDPGRPALRRGLWDYITENADYPYYMIRSRFAGAEGRSFRSLRKGEGSIVEHDGAMVAAYRDMDDTLILRSATCTHMGCRVAWNQAERTWDCPCHGSRFTPRGDVISGPAETPLSEVRAASTTLLREPGSTGQRP